MYEILVIKSDFWWDSPNKSRFTSLKWRANGVFVCVSVWVRVHVRVWFNILFATVCYFDIENI